MTTPSLLSTPVDAERIRYGYDTGGRGGWGIDEAPLRAAAEQARRSSLVDAVRVSKALFPAVYATLEGARVRVAPWLDVEAFVWSDPSPQAWCISVPGDDRVLLGLTSGIVELLDPEELAFVVGHEIGHALFGHVGHALERESGEVSVLAARALSRAAEISADRLGRLATSSTGGATGAILKVASGLGGRHLRLDVATFLDQLADLPEGYGGAMRTHPVFALRCRALLWFEQSDAFARVIGGHGDTRRELAEIDERIERELSATLGFGHARANEEALRMGTLWGALGLFVLDSRLERSEQEVMRRFCGEEPADKAIRFVREHGPETVPDKLRAALRQVATLPERDREGLLGDLEVLAGAAGGTEEQRMEFLTGARDTLGLERPTRIRVGALDHG